MILFFTRERSPNLTLFACLRRVVGLNKHNILFICRLFGFKFNVPIKHVNISTIKKIEFYVESNYITGMNLRRKIRSREEILRKQNIYRGLRHRQFLPVHFQRTHSNANSARYRYQPRKKRKGGKKKNGILKKIKLKL
jgi:ribosomal protein S13